MQPNIILIVLDSLRADFFGPQLSGHSQTPLLDRFARQSVVFEQAVAQGSSTPPSVKSFMSSTYANEYDGPTSRLTSTRPYLPAFLSPAGYASAAITPNEYLSAARGWGRDFDLYDDCDRNAEYRRLHLFRGLNKIGKQLGYPLELPISLPAEILFERARTWIQDTHQPFFLWVQPMDTHWPYRIQKFSLDPAWQLGQHRERTRVRPVLISDSPRFTDQEHESLVDQYCTAIQYSDRQVAAFLEDLSRTGRLENTVVIIMADHGEEFGEHGRYFHSAHLYDELVHVPLLVHLPERFSPVNRSYPGQVRLLDVVPTIMDLAGIPAPEETRGSSLLPILQGAQEVDRLAISEAFSGQDFSVRQDGWKYLYNTETQRAELYHLADDPGEKQSVLDQHADVAAELHAVLDDHWSHLNRAQAPEVEIAADDTEMINRLRDLGYVD